MKNFLNKKISRLLVSKNVMKIFYYYHFLKGGFKSKKIDINFSDKKTRQQIVQNIIDLKRYENYLEIGTFKNDLFSYIKCKNKFGVDPVSGGNIRKTSDEFFETNDKTFDIIFIDGLHHYNQVKKDIQNSISVLKDDGIILIHDCMPRNFYYQAIPRCQLNWNGDTWKAFLEFRSMEHLDAYCCYADEGIGVIFKRKNKNRLEINYKDFSKIDFNEFIDNYKIYLNLIEYDDLIKIIQNYE